jgi:hypothetical protein
MIHQLLAILCVVGLLACGERRTSPTQPGAECSDPIPITHVANAIPNSYIVEFRTGVDSVSETARLEAKYGFHAQAVYQHVLSGFGAQLTEANVRGLQCESSIAAITENPAGQPPP